MIVYVILTDKDERGRQQFWGFWAGWTGPRMDVWGVRGQMFNAHLVSYQDRDREEGKSFTVLDARDHGSEEAACQKAKNLILEAQRARRFA